MVILDARDDPPDGSSIDRAAAALAEGELVAVPTDTVYGLAADLRHPAATRRLFAVKGRPTAVALPVLVGGRDQVVQLAGTLEPQAARLAAAFWPGPLTLVLPRRPGFAADLGGSAEARDTVGVRWPDHPVVAALCRRIGPLVVTSANRHGEPPAVTAVDAVALLAGDDGPGDEAGVDGPPSSAGASDGRQGMVLDGGRCDGVPSTVVACTGGSIRCLREGALPFDRLAAEAAAGGAKTEDGGDRG